MNVSLRPFDELVAKLREHGFSECADEISMLLSLAWTTSSEFVGELGLAVLRFQREHPAVSTDLQDTLNGCMKEVRIVWPDIK
jgi:hypothetical protein